MGAFPGSLPEGAGSPQGLTEGVSSDGCSMPTIHTPAHINSEIFERLRASGYTPSVSHSLDSSLREGAGNGCGGGYQSTEYLLKSRVAGDFHRPYENSEVGTFHHSTDDTPSVSHSLDSSLREGAGKGGYQSTEYLLKSRVAGDFHRPYENSEVGTFHHSTGYTPSVSHSLDSSLREGAGKGGY